MPKVSHPAQHNQLLAALPAESLAKLQPHLLEVAVERNQCLIQIDEPIAAVYFPLTSWASMMAQLEDGRRAEVGTVGSEGMLGLSVLSTDRTSPFDAVTIVAGTMLRLNSKVFQQALQVVPELERLLFRYSLQLHRHACQTVACNGRHTCNHRLARWLVMAHDRTGRDDFWMTYDFLAMVLASHRPSVTVAAQFLQKRGLIHYTRSRMTIIDRPGLQAAACECHGVMHPKNGAMSAHSAA